MVGGSCCLITFYFITYCHYQKPLMFMIFYESPKHLDFRLFHFKTDFTDILHYDNTGTYSNSTYKVKVTPSVNVFFIASSDCHVI